MKKNPLFALVSLLVASVGCAATAQASGCGGNNWDHPSFGHQDYGDQGCYSHDNCGNRHPSIGQFGGGGGGGGGASSSGSHGSSSGFGFGFGGGTGGGGGGGGGSAGDAAGAGGGSGH